MNTQMGEVMQVHATTHVYAMSTYTLGRPKTQIRCKQQPKMLWRQVQTSSVDPQVQT